jgi:predicted nucleotidyltransferase component of viral defense system
MIDQAERDEWAQRFGVSPAQIGRDHFISHVLRGLGELHPETRFFGGTALCRTGLDQTRLSEDIDLLDPEPREFLDALREELPTAVRREYPDTTWSAVSFEGDGMASALSSPSVAAVKIYVGHDGSNTAAWEFTETPVQLRYKDLPPHQLFRCPTLPTFAAMKLCAWSNRQAPRDLFDLAGLAALGTFRDPSVSRIFEAKMGVPIIVADFNRLPKRTAQAWNTELAAQVGILPSAEDCLSRVRAALASCVA